MCGIITLFSKNDSISSEALQKGLSQLAHRGPDAQKTWVSRTGRVGMGHSRLSIIDLSTGDQPLHNEESQIHAVVNGELYGYEEIRKELIEKGHHFQTHSDSEIIIHLYEEMGTRCLERLRGEFAFVLWDEANEVLFAARDRFGIKPLFYSHHHDTIALASEMKALFGAGIQPRWDLDAVFQMHQAFLFSEGQGLFQGVSQIPPGHFLLATRSQTQVRSYWDFNYPPQNQIQTISDSEAIEFIREKIHEAVRLRLRADVPVACYLSGGLDSCALLGIASTYLKQPLRAFTLSFDRAEYDELEVAREMAAHAGAEFTPISVLESDLAQNFPDAVWNAETILMNTHGVAKFLLSKAVREAGYKVVLTGEGSDEIFAGYPHFRKDMVLFNTQGQDPETVQNLLGELYKNNAVSQGFLFAEGFSEKTRAVRNALGFVPSFMESFAFMGDTFQGVLSSSFLQGREGRDPYRIFFNEMDVTRQLKGRDPVHQSLYLWSKICLPNYILSVLGDRMEMGHSIEGRVPFLDHHLVESVVKMPVTQKIRGMTEKFLLREAAKPYLTDTVYRRQKHPFLAPPVAARSGGPLSEFLHDTLRGKSLESLPFYDAKKVAGLLDRLPDMDHRAKTALDPILMIMVSLSVLQQRYGVSSC